VGSLDFDILGEVRAWRDGDEVDLGTAKQRAVLAVLLLEANQPVPAARIVAAVWGAEPPANGANVVQKYVAGLRRALEPDRSPRSPSRVLALQPAGYRLAVGPGCLDADVMAAQVRQAEAAARAGELDRAADLLAGVLGRWDGEPLAGLYGPVFEAARQRLVERRAAAAELRAEVLLRAGRHAEALPELATLVGEFPYRERLHGLHLEALYRSGRQAEALAAYAVVRRRLVDEVGVEPGAALREVHERILRADPVPLPARPALPDPAPATRGSGPPDSWPPESWPPEDWPPGSAPPGSAPLGSAPLGSMPRPTGAPAWIPPGGPGLMPPVRADPAPGPRGWRWWTPRTVVSLLSLLSFGYGTWLVFGLLASWHHRIRYAYYGAGYLALTVVTVTATSTEEPWSATRNAVFGSALALSWLGGTTHVAITMFRTRRVPDQGGVTSA
jgi:DNA-binding SARP family transcriptional activator